MAQAQRSTAVKRAIRRRTEHLAEAFRPSRPKASANGTALVAGSRLVDSPVFVLAAAAPGPELLRSLLDRHPEVTVPADLQLASIKVEPKRAYSEAIMDAIGLDRWELEHLLWDRVLHHELVRSGKRIVVDDSVANALMWQRIAEAWPSARYILVRHDSAEPAELAAVLDEAQKTLDVVSVQHVALSADPAGELQRICGYLGVGWSPEMLVPAAR